MSALFPEHKSDFQVENGKMSTDLETCSPDEINASNIKRRLGFFSGSSMIVGVIIGSGIFISPRSVLQRSGSVGFSLVVWIISGLIALFGGLSYAELGTIITSSGAEYAYLLHSLGPMAAFLFSWTSVLIIRPSLLAILSLSFAEYFLDIFSVSELNFTTASILVGIANIYLITFINCYSVHVAANVQNVFTAAKLLAIAIIIVFGIIFLAQGNVENFYRPFDSTSQSASSIVTALYSGMWAYDGWNNLNYATEEIINPSKNLPRSLVCAIPTVIFCYVLVNLSYYAVLDFDEIVSHSDTVVDIFAHKTLTFAPWIMSVFVSISTFSSANGTCFASGRLCFAAAREGHLFDILSYTHATRSTPIPALVLNAILSTVIIYVGKNVEVLIDTFSFTVAGFYLLTMLSLLYLRYKKPDIHRPYKVPLLFPCLMLVTSIFLVIVPLVLIASLNYLIAVVFMLVGCVVYCVCVRHGHSVKSMDSVNNYVQKLLNVVPCSNQC